MGNITGRGMLRGNITSIPRIDNTLTKKGQAADAEAVGIELGKKINYTDVVNSLDSAATDKPLSANMGKVIDENIKQAKQSLSADIKLVSDELDAYQQSNDNAIAQATQNIQGNADAIAETNNKVNGIAFGKVFTYVGDGSNQDRVIDTGLNCNALIVIGGGETMIIPKNGKGIAIFGSNYNPNLTQTVMSAGATLVGTELHISFYNDSTGGSNVYRANDLMNRDGITYTCLAI